VAGGGPYAHIVSLGDDFLRPDWLVAPFADSLGLERSHEQQPEDIVFRNAGRFEWPQLVVICLPESAPAEAQQKAENHAGRMSTATKDLRGPITFLLLLRWRPGTQMEGCLVWAPVTAFPEEPPFWDGAQHLVRAGFKTYLALRAYWEAAGQPQALEQLRAIFESEAALMAAPDPDERIDGLFDRLATAADDPTSVAELFSAAFDSDSCRSVLRTGVILHSRLPLPVLEAAGLAWCPPGCPRPVLTSRAAHALERHRVFSATYLEEAHQRLGVRCAARRNPLLSTWIGSLVSHVEREMLAVCQRDEEINGLLDTLALAPQLRLERSRSPRHFAYDPPGDLVSYASFGELQTLITKSHMAAAFPVSSKRINDMRHIRNLTAHLHPVTWRAARCVLETIQHFLGRT
jgi:hypothetical protein